MNYEYPGIAKPFSLPASRDKNQSSGDQTLTGRWLQPNSKPPQLPDI